MTARQPSRRNWVAPALVAILAATLPWPSRGDEGYECDKTDDCECLRCRG